MSDAAEIELVNRAVSLLIKELASALPGGNDIDDADFRKHEMDAARLLPIAKREALARKPWPAATRTKVIDKAKTQPDYAKALGLAVFRTPNDFIRLCRVHEDGSARWRGHEIEATDRPSLTIDYVADVRVSELRYDPLLFAFVATHLAFLLARPLTDARTAQAQIFELAADAERRAWGASLGQQRAGYLPMSSVDQAMSALDPDQERRFR